MKNSAIHRVFYFEFGMNPQSESEVSASHRTPLSLRDISPFRGDELTKL